MDFLRIAGSEEMLNDWNDHEPLQPHQNRDHRDGKMSYVKTDIGQKLHEVLKVHAYLGPALGDLGRDRRRPR